jgi:Protein of unknown function (DUF3987)
MEERARYDSLTKEQKAETQPPKCTQVLFQDATIEAAQEILKDNPDGALCFQDELSGFFGAIEKYTGGRGAQKDRAFWLESYSGAPYTVNRIGRGIVFIENLSVSLLGGIQPEPIRKIADGSADDGLLQRFFPVVLKPAVPGRDEEASPAVEEYATLIDRLHGLEGLRFGGILRFDDGAQTYRQELDP